MLLIFCKALLWCHFEIWKAITDKKNALNYFFGELIYGYMASLDGQAADIQVESMDVGADAFYPLH